MALWKEIAGYEGRYWISDEGEVASIPTKHNKYMKKKTLTPIMRGKNGYWYLGVGLSKDGKRRYHAVHRLVAQAFIPNPDGLPEINHIDRNTKNNKVNNLEWCCRQYNVEYGHNKKVNMLNRNGGHIETFDSATQASAKTGIGRRNICNALNGWAKAAGGYVWEYA